MLLALSGPAGAILAEPLLPFSMYLKPPLRFYANIGQQTLNDPPNKQILANLILALH